MNIPFVPWILWVWMLLLWCGCWKDVALSTSSQTNLSRNGTSIWLEWYHTTQNPPKKWPKITPDGRHILWIYKKIQKSRVWFASDLQMFGALFFRAVCSCYLLMFQKTGHHRKPWIWKSMEIIRNHRDQLATSQLVISLYVIPTSPPCHQVCFGFFAGEVNLHYGDLVDSSNLASIMAKAERMERLTWFQMGNITTKRHETKDLEIKIHKGYTSCAEKVDFRMPRTMNSKDPKWQ